MKKEKGSITIFSLLSLLLVTATIFALLEGSRLQEMHQLAELQTENALESAFANYNSCLWENYRLLGANGNEMQEVIEQTAAGRAGEGTNFFRLKPEDISILGEAKITDGNGAVFIKSVSSYMKENFVYEAAKEVYSQYEAIKKLLESDQMNLSNITDALQEMNKASIEIVEPSVETRIKRDVDTQIDVRSLLEIAEDWKEMGILNLVLQDTENLSKAQHDFSTGLLKRNLEKGRNSVETTIDWMDRLLLQQYLMTYMSNFAEEKENRALSYEIEHLLGQKSSDIENLKVTANKLLAVREAANFLYLLSNSVCMAQAEAMATLFVGVTANPLLIQAVKIGLLTAWALAESILDVRAILEGKRIALLKSEESWTIALENLGEISKEFLMAKESKWGLDYEDYLGILLLMEQENSLAMNTMNLQEATIRQNYANDSFGIDTLITQANVKVRYSYKPIFPFLQVINADNRWEYNLSAEACYGYY